MRSMRQPFPPDPHSPPKKWWGGTRACGLVLLATLFLLPFLSTKAWDADRMFVAAQALGPRALAGARALQLVLVSVAGADEIERLQAVNLFFNSRILFREDQEVWGQADYWASPLETLDKGRGDCEDYAIAKYFALLTTGLPESRLRMVYVRAQVGGQAQAHMVLAYYATPASEPLILDNLLNEIRPAARRPDLAPVFSFNSEGLWQGVAGASAGDPQARLSRWRAALAKARSEGFQ